MDYIHKINFNIVRGRSALPVSDFLPYMWMEQVGEEELLDNNKKPYMSPINKIHKLPLPDCPQSDWICKGDKIIEMTSTEKSTKKAEIDLMDSNNRHPRLILSQIKLAFGDKRKDFIFDLFNHNSVFLLCMDARDWKDAHYAIDRIKKEDCSDADKKIIKNLIPKG